MFCCVYLLFNLHEDMNDFFWNSKKLFLTNVLLALVEKIDVVFCQKLKYIETNKIENMNFELKKMKNPFQHCRLYQQS